MYTFLKAKSALKLVFSRGYKEKVFGLYGGRWKMYTFLKVKSALKLVFSRAKRKKVFGV